MNVLSFFVATLLVIENLFPWNNVRGQRCASYQQINVFIAFVRICAPVIYPSINVIVVLFVRKSWSSKVCIVTVYKQYNLPCVYYCFNGRVNFKSWKIQSLFSFLHKKSKGLMIPKLFLSFKVSVLLQNDRIPPWRNWSCHVTALSLILLLEQWRSYVKKLCNSSWYSWSGLLPTFWERGK